MAFESARHTTSFVLSRLFAQIEALRAKPYPGGYSGPSQWLEIISGLVDTANAYLAASEAAGLQPLEAATLIEDANKLAITAYRWLGWCDGATAEDMPYAVVAPMHHWFEAAGLKSSIFFRAELAANYEIGWINRQDIDRFRDPSPRLTKALSAVRWPFARITVPSKALGILPHFAIVAHEIGHDIAIKINFDFSMHATALTALDNRIKARLGGAPLTAQLNNYLTEVKFRWLQEVAADAFGHLMAGPAFFFAWCEFSQAIGGGLGISETHPPNMLRRAFLYKRLTTPVGTSFADIYLKEIKAPLNLDINSELLPILPSPNDLIVMLQSTGIPARLSTSQHPSLLEKAAVLVELVEYIETIVDEVYKQTEQHLKAINNDLLYTPDKFAADIAQHLTPLLYAIPPIEGGGPIENRKASEFATILNVGWLALLNKIDDIGIQSDSESDKIEKLNSLLLKAAELSVARQSWEKA